MSWAVVTVAYAHRASRETTGTINRLTILARTVRGRIRLRHARVADASGASPVGFSGAASSAGGPACARRPRTGGWCGVSGVVRGVRMASSLGTGSVRCRRTADGRARRYRAVLSTGCWAEADASRSPAVGDSATKAEVRKR